MTLHVNVALGAAIAQANGQNLMDILRQVAEGMIPPHQQVTQASRKSRDLCDKHQLTSRVLVFVRSANPHFSGLVALGSGKGYLRATADLRVEIPHGWDLNSIRAIVLVYNPDSYGDYPSVPVVYTSDSPRHGGKLEADIAAMLTGGATLAPPPAVSQLTAAETAQFTAYAQSMADNEAKLYAEISRLQAQVDILSAVAAKYNAVAPLILTAAETIKG